MFLQSRRKFVWRLKVNLIFDLEESAEVLNLRASALSFFVLNLI